MTNDTNIIKLMNTDIDNANLDVCESLDAHGDTLFLDYRTINIMVEGWQSLAALQELFGFENTAQLSHLVLWPIQAFDEGAQDILQRKDINGDTLVDVVVFSHDCYDGEIPTSKTLPIKDERFVEAPSTNSCLPWLFHNIVKKVPSKKKLLLLDNIHTLGFSSSKCNQYVITQAKDAFFECLPQCNCDFPQTKAFIIKALDASKR